MSLPLLVLGPAGPCPSSKTRCPRRLRKSCRFSFVFFLPNPLLFGEVVGSDDDCRRVEPTMNGIRKQCAKKMRIPPTILLHISSGLEFAGKPNESFGV